MKDKDIKNKRLLLFVLEICLVKDKGYIDESLIAQINDFIYLYYEENQELFELIFDIKLLEEFIKNKYEIISSKILINLIKKYKKEDGYILLVDEVGYEIDQKLNILVMKFLEYYSELLELKNAKPRSIYYKILQ